MMLPLRVMPRNTKYDAQAAEEAGLLADPVDAPDEAERNLHGAPDRETAQLGEADFSGTPSDIA